MLAGARPDKLAAVERFLAGEPLPDTERRARRARPEPAPGDKPSSAGADGGSAWLFRWTGRDWKVVYGGGEPFYLPGTQGAAYVDYLLHNPNIPISAFDLEVAVQPEKGGARSRNSIQPESDAQACRQYREVLRRLRDQRQEAQAAGDREAVEEVDEEIEVLEAALGASSTPDTGERAYDNVRQRVRSVMEHLRKQGQQERAFAEHLRTHLSIGFECLYSQPEGRIWS